MIKHHFNEALNYLYKYNLEQLSKAFTCDLHVKYFSGVCLTDI